MEGVSTRVFHDMFSVDTVFVVSPPPMFRTKQALKFVRAGVLSLVSHVRYAVCVVLVLLVRAVLLFPV